MKRNIIFVLFVLLVLGGTLLARESTVLKVKVQSANVRAEADAAAPVIAKVSIGTLLEASGRDGAGYEVTVNNSSGKEVSGYIQNSVVKVFAGDEEEEKTPQPRPAARRPAPKYKATKEFARGGAKLMAGLSMGNLTFSDPISTEVK